MTPYDADLLSRSLEEIEDDRWGPAPQGCSRLVSTVHRLRQVPVGMLQVVLALLPTVDRDDLDYPAATDLDDKIAEFLHRHE